MIDSKWRAQVQPIFDQGARGLNRLGLTPAFVTVLALLTGLGAGFAIGYGQYSLAILLLWLSGALDVLDGTLARHQNKESQFGAYMDLIFDRVVEGAVVLGFYFSAPEHPLSYLVFFMGAMFNFTTFMVVGALFKNEGNKSMHYDVGIVERTETFVVFTLMLLWPAYGFAFLMVFNGIMVLTGIIRFYRIYKHEKTKVRGACGEKVH